MTLDNDLLDLWLLAGLVGGLDEATAKRLIDELQDARSELARTRKALFDAALAVFRAADKLPDEEVELLNAEWAGPQTETADTEIPA